MLVSRFIKNITSDYIYVIDSIFIFYFVFHFSGHFAIVFEIAPQLCSFYSAFYRITTSTFAGNQKLMHSYVIFEAAVMCMHNCTCIIKAHSVRREPMPLYNKPLFCELFLVAYMYMELHLRRLICNNNLNLINQLFNQDIMCDISK